MPAQGSAIGGYGRALSYNRSLLPTSGQDAVPRQSWSVMRACCCSVEQAESLVQKLDGHVNAYTQVLPC